MFLNNLKHDIKPSIIVFLVALPLCLGIALASEAPLFSGLLAGIIGGLVVGALSGSHVSVSGPAAGLTVTVAMSIQELGSFQTFTLAVLIAGFIQVVLGAVRGGTIGDYFPNSVIRGMLAAIGVIILKKQWPFLLGWVKGVGVHPGVIAIGASSLGLLVVWRFLEKRYVVFKMLPGGLTVVILGVGLHIIFSRYVPQLALGPEHLVNLNFEGGLTALWQQLRFPNWSELTNPAIYPAAVTIAVITSLASLLSLDAADDMDPKKRTSSKNRELIAQGAGNMCAGLIGAIPIAAVIVRTTANASAGAVSRYSAIMHGLWLILCVVFFPKLVSLIPLASLAAILVTVGLKLTPPALYRSMYKLKKDTFLPFITTIVVVLATDLLKGVGAGMVMSMFFIMHSLLRTPVKREILPTGEHTIKFLRDASFLNKSALKGILQSVPDGATVIVDNTMPVSIDRDIILAFEDLMASSKKRNIVVRFEKRSFSNHDFYKD